MGRKIKVAGNIATLVSLSPIAPVQPHRQQTLDAANAYTPQGPQDARYLLCQVNGAGNARYTLAPESAPTTTVGFVMTAGDPAVLIPLGPDVTPRFIAETAAVLEFMYCE